jgi:hypothetical protein
MRINIRLPILPVIILSFIGCSAMYLVSLRQAAIKLRFSGVGFCPHPNSVHVDVGPVCSWWDRRPFQQRLIQRFISVINIITEMNGFSILIHPSGYVNDVDGNRLH